VIAFFPPRLDRGGYAQTLVQARPSHLTGTFTYGSGDTRAELDDIIARSRQLW
jgi:hypothetical protein